MDNNIKVRENRVRRKLARQGYRLHKSRTNGCVYRNRVFQGLNIDDYGGYMIVDSTTNSIAGGWKIDWDLEDVERFADE